MTIKRVLLVLLSFQVLTLHAQNQIHGKVIDSLSNNAMPFVNIAVVGSTYGTISNQNGAFSINLDKINSNDSVAFHFIGYETNIKRIGDLKDDLTIRMQEKRVKLRTIAIVANPLSPKELIKKAIEMKGKNYPQISQKREVFKRTNTASYINTITLSLEKSTTPAVDNKLVTEVADSMPRYSRSYEDNLYNLYSIPGDSLNETRKVIGIKTVKLKEDNGGELERASRIITDLANDNADKDTFWKYKTGPISVRDSHVQVTGLDDDSTRMANRQQDSVKNIEALYELDEDLGWNWDYIQKMNKYKYLNTGIISVEGEDAYAISFRGKPGTKDEGMIYISVETFAILRIEYAIKKRKREKGFNLLGISFKDIDDSGLLIYNKDEFGYYLKYSMHSSASKYGIDRAFSIIKKQKKPPFNKKLWEVALDMNLQGLQESCTETLIVSRKIIDDINFTEVKEKGVKSDRITSYSDTIWQGYSIIEPTKQMKEYKVKITHDLPLKE